MFQECFLAYYRSQTQRLHDHFMLAVTSCDPDGIHDLRVDIKQLKAFFTLIKRIAPTFRAKKNLRKIRKLFQAAAEIRDVQVQQELTSAWIKQYGLDLSAYANSLKQKELPARKRFTKFAKSFDLTKKVAKNEKKIARALQNLADEDAAAKTGERVERLLAKILKFGRENKLQPDHLHKLRILTKKARYTIEVARQCFPESGYREEFSEKLRGVHQVLGKWHDHVIALEHVEAFQAENPDQSPPLYAELSNHLQQEKTDLLAAFEEKWNEFATYLKE